MAEYIDKQAFNDAIREAVRKYPNTFYNGLEVARQIAHDMDAADVQPVIHGRWREGAYAGYRCSECRTTWDAPTYFCPNCGAKMDGGKT